MIKPMLASPVDLEKLQFPVMVSPKIDGVRCLIVHGRAMSRNGIEIPNRYVQQMIGDPRFEGLDGELTVGASNAHNLMQMTTSGTMSIEGTPDFVFNVFDYWNGSPSEGFQLRYSKLAEAFTKGWFTGVQTHVRLLEHRVAHNMDELLLFKITSLEHGFEGTMIRSLGGPYKQGRSTTKQGYLVKLKEWASSEATVIGFQEFMHNGNKLEEDAFGYAKRSSAKDGKVAMDTLGALLVRDITTGVEFSIGTGFDAALRKHIWDSQTYHIGRIVTYKHFDTVGVKDAPRFPVFVAFRDQRDM